jgi:hypothetical protein
VAWVESQKTSNEQWWAPWTVAGSSSVLRRATLGDGTAEPSLLGTGPGTYRVTVTPASGSTRWSIEVQDDY